jgi:hypothetical protein
MEDDLVAGASGASQVIDGWRFYRLGSMLGAAVVLGPGYGTICVLVWVLDYYVHNHGSVLGLIVGLAVIVSAFSGLCWWCLRTGVRETDDGLVTFYNFTRSTVRWDDIEAFDVGNLLWWKRVVARRREGKAVMLAVAPGKRVRWHGGSTLDAVALLNERLGEVRHAKSQ